jgi:hypothetical protein
LQFRHKWQKISTGQHGTHDSIYLGGYIVIPATTAAGWQGLYDSGGFAITTTKPSRLVADYCQQIPAGAPVADLGCGELRNSAFLAAQGRLVHACDVADLGQQERLPPGVEFGCHGVEDFGFRRGLYGAILAIRLIQYLPPGTLSDLIRRAAEGLATGGLLLVSYTVGGGILDRPDLAVPKFIHPIPAVIGRIESAGLELTLRDDFITTQQNTNLEGTLHVCELVAKKSLFALRRRERITCNKVVLPHVAGRLAFTRTKPGW